MVSFKNVFKFFYNVGNMYGVGKDGKCFALWKKGKRSEVINSHQVVAMIMSDNSEVTRVNFFSK